MAICSTHCSTVLEQVKKRISSGPTTQTKMVKATTKFHRRRYITVSAGMLEKPVANGQNFEN